MPINLVAKSHFAKIFLSKLIVTYFLNLRFLKIYVDKQIKMEPKTETAVKTTFVRPYAYS